MERYCPKRIKEKFKLYKGIELKDVVFMLIGLVIGVVVLVLGGIKTLLIPKLIAFALIIMVTIIINVPLGDENAIRIRSKIGYMFKYFFRGKKYSSCNLNEDLGIKHDGFVMFNPARNLYMSVVEVNASLISLKNEDEADIYIAKLDNALNSLTTYSIIKTEIALNVTDYYLNNIANQKRVLGELGGGLESISKRAFLKEEEYMLKNYIAKEYYNPRYFILVYNKSKEDLINSTYTLVNNLSNANLESVICDEKTTNKLFKYYYDGFITDDNDFTFNSWKENGFNISMHVGKDDKGKDIYKKFKVINIAGLPQRIQNSWIDDLTSIEGVKLSFKVEDAQDSGKVKSALSSSLMELKLQLNSPLKVDKKMDIEDQMQRVANLINQLNYGDETIRKCYISFLVPLEKEREFTKTARKNNIILDKMAFRQAEGFMSCDLYKFLNMKPLKNVGLDLPSSIIASAYPFTSAMFFDTKGQFVGTSFGYPVFFNHFYNLDGDSSLRVNANISITGTSGVGKSYLSKILLLNDTIACNKIRILDPENEYDVFCKNLLGKDIDVAGGDETINPLQVFPSLKEDNNNYSNDVTLHKQFLDQFFKTAVRRIHDDDILSSYLNRCIDVLYYRWNISDDLPLPQNPEDYPIMQDLFNVIEEEWQRLDQAHNDYEARYFKDLLVLLNSFIGTGLRAKLWNHYTTLKLDNPLVVFNFQGLLTSSNQDVSASQMLLIMKFLNQEVIANRNQNLATGGSNKMTIMVDEAHNFISKDYPVALSFLYKMSKQIRKYNGSLIVTTQQINDFLGGDENTRKLAKGIISNCQYSFIFGNPNSVNEVKELYGEIMTFTYAEETIIKDNAKGVCLLQLSPAVRTVLRVKSTGDSAEFFSNKELLSKFNTVDFQKLMEQADLNSGIITEEDIIHKQEQELSEVETTPSSDSLVEEDTDNYLESDDETSSEDKISLEYDEYEDVEKQPSKTDFKEDFSQEELNPKEDLINPKNELKIEETTRTYRKFTR